MASENINKSIISDIAKLVAFHKDELLDNIRALGYILSDTNDQTIVYFIATKSIEKPVADMLAMMITKYKTENSNASGIWGGISDVITDVFSQSEKTKQKQEQSKQTELLAEIEKQKTEQERLKTLAAQKTKLSRKTLLLVGSATALVLIVILIVSRKSKVQPQAV